MINTKYQDGKEKPEALYTWQLKYNVHDEDPLYPIAAAIFSLLGEMPSWINEMQCERHVLYSLQRRYQLLIDVRLQNLETAYKTWDAKQAATQAKITESLERLDRILVVMRKIDENYHTQILADIEYDKIATPLQKRLEEITKTIPIERIAIQVEKLKSSGNEIQMAASQIRESAQVICETRTPKRELLIAAAGGILGTALLVALLLLLSTGANKIPAPVQSGPAIEAPSQP
jgi:hypothetical protein